MTNKIPPGIVILTMPNCTGCEKIRNILKRKKIKYYEVDITKSKMGRAGIRSVPVVLKDGNELIGKELRDLLGGKL